MKRGSKILLFLIAITASLLTSCIEKEQYPLEPVISYAGFAVDTSALGYDSTGYITINYTDGDGDIGLYDTDSVEPYKYNYYLTFKQLINGQLVALEFPVEDDTLNNINFNGRIPILTPTTANKNISGMIQRKIELHEAWYFLESDTIAFEIYIKDRALNISNVVQSPLYLFKRPHKGK